MLIPGLSIIAISSAVICGLIAATLCVIRRAMAANLQTTFGLWWLKCLDCARWFFQILFTWGLITAVTPMQVAPFVASIITFFQLYAAISNGRRERQSLGLLMVQVHAARGSLPDLLDSYGRSNPTVIGAKARLIGEALRRGESLLAASQRLRLRLPTSIRLALDSAHSHHSKRLLEATVSTQDPASISKVVMMGAYLPFLLLLMTGCFAFMSVMIIPTFNAMFEEFELRSQGLALLNILGKIVMPLFYLACLSACVYVGIVVFLWMIGFTQALRALPIVGPIFVLSRRAMMLDALAFTSEQKLSLPDAFRVIGQATNYRSERMMLAKCLTDCQQGRSLNDALRRIISPKQATWVEAAQRTNHLPEAFQSLASLIRMRLYRRTELSVSLLVPIATLLCSLPVLVLCYALIQALTDMVLALS